LRAGAMLILVFEALTGFGLATSAGLNAYIPLLAIGLLTRYTDVITLPSGWQWLDNGWMLAILSGLLVIEMIADKIPTVDHVNDVIQTVVRPTSGGLAFGATSGAHTAAVSDPSSLLADRVWLPIALGVGVALVVHATKATARLLINATTFGIGGPVVSVIEDAVSVLVALAAILLPVGVVVVIGVLIWLTVRTVRRRLRQRAARRMARA
jgi:hypothetical protein